jgi:hypothetical protein
MRYFHEPGDTTNVPRQEAFNAWALERLAVVVPQKVEYRKHSSRAAMARYTGQGNANGFAEPERFVFHTIWPYDNHEVVHVYTALVGRPSDFFNEGIAVSFGTDPSNSNFSVRFNGLLSRQWARGFTRHDSDAFSADVWRHVGGVGSRLACDTAVNGGGGR